MTKVLSKSTWWLTRKGSLGHLYPPKKCSIFLHNKEMHESRATHATSAQASSPLTCNQGANILLSIAQHQKNVNCADASKKLVSDASQSFVCQFKLGKENEIATKYKNTCWTNTLSSWENSAYDKKLVIYSVLCKNILRHNQIQHIAILRHNRTGRCCICCLSLEKEALQKEQL